MPFSPTATSSPVQPSAKDLAAVRDWLRSAGLAKHVETLFRNNFNSLVSIAGISNHDLNVMGITTIGSRRKMLSAASVLRSQLGLPGLSNEETSAADESANLTTSSANTSTSSDASPTKKAAENKADDSVASLTGVVVDATSPTSPAASTQPAQPLTPSQEVLDKHTELVRSLRQEIKARDLVIAEMQADSEQLKHLVTELQRREVELAARTRRCLEEMSSCDGCKNSTIYVALTSASRPSEELMISGETAPPPASAGSDMRPASRVTIQETSSTASGNGGPAAITEGGGGGGGRPPLVPKTFSYHIDERPLTREVEWNTVKSITNDLSKENADLEAVVEAADTLLLFERQDKPIITKIDPETGRELLLRRRSYELDVALFKHTVGQRVKAMNEPPRPPPYTLHKMQPPNYAELMREQDKMIQQRELDNVAYKEYVDRCLASSLENARNHLEVGEFRDPTERKLKIQLARVIQGKVVDLGDKDDEMKDLALPKRLAKFDGIHDQLTRRMEELTKQIDTSGDGVLQKDEIAAAIARNKPLEEELSMLAVNLALCPENRLQSDNQERNQLLQEILDYIASHMDNDGDGLLSIEELKAAPEYLKEKMRRLGIDVKL